MPAPPRSGPPRAAAVVVDSIEVDGPVGSHAIEALQLEIRGLARACGLDVVELRVERRPARGSG